MIQSRPWRLAPRWARNEPAGSRIEPVLVDVAEGHDVLAGTVLDIAGAHPIEPHAGDVELLARRLVAWAS